MFKIVLCKKLPEIVEIAEISTVSPKTGLDENKKKALEMIYNWNDHLDIINFEIDDKIRTGQSVNYLGRRASLKTTFSFENSDLPFSEYSSKTED